MTVANASPSRGWGLRADTTGGLLAKIALLAVITAIAVWLAIPLLAAEMWVPLILVVLTTIALYVIYLQPRHIPIKYLVPGTIFLLLFQVIPVIFTVSTAFTNFGDGHRGTKEEAITSIESGSVQQVPGSAEYVLTIAAERDPAVGVLVYLLVDPATNVAQRGDADGLEPFPDAVLNERGKVTEAPQGLVLLSAAEVGARTLEIEQFFVPTANGAIKNQGLSRAFEGRPTRVYEETCDCISNAETAESWVADNSVGSFVDANGQTLPQGWQVNVGLANFTRAFTDPTVSGPFLGILVWNFAFAILSVTITFVAGLLVAMALNSPELRALRFYRLLIVLPYAMPSFAMLLVWRDLFNQDFGLINQLTGQDINWFGEPWSARAAILIIQFWLGYPYMFLVCLGALQSIPKDLTEAAAVDGAKRYQAFRAVVFPLLLVSVAPLLISSFAFNFNNFNIIALTTNGGPFPPDNPRAGATDILVSLVYKLAFAAGGAQYGFAAAVSLLIFFIVATVSIIGFRRTAALEEINR